jgi:hypothetical protein|tara:strand:+ start:606 stop:749 length:144 start_codon:yes stop_codon:yes gene_type:complete
MTLQKIKELIRKYEQENRDKLKQVSIATQIKEVVDTWVKEIVKNYRG